MTAELTYPITSGLPARLHQMEDAKYEAHVDAIRVDKILVRVTGGKIGSRTYAIIKTNAPFMQLPASEHEALAIERALASHKYYDEQRTGDCGCASI